MKAKKSSELASRAAHQCNANRSLLRRGPVIRTIIATFVILTPGIILGSEGQTLPSADHGSQAAQTQPSSLSRLAVQGRQHASYQVFAGHLALPSITVVDKTTLDVGGKVRIAVSRLGELNSRQRETLAGQFEVPVAMVDNLLKHFSNKTPSDAKQMAGELRVAVIDFKYLLERWTRYLPPAGKENVKSDALLALRVGDMDKAWRMYVELPRPKPPTGLTVSRIVGQN